MSYSAVSAGFALVQGPHSERTNVTSLVIAWRNGAVSDRVGTDEANVGFAVRSRVLGIGLRYHNAAAGSRRGYTHDVLAIRAGGRLQHLGRVTAVPTVAASDSASLARLSCASSCSCPAVPATASSPAAGVRASVSARFSGASVCTTFSGAPPVAAAAGC